MHCASQYVHHSQCTSSQLQRAAHDNPPYIIHKRTNTHTHSHGVLMQSVEKKACPQCHGPALGVHHVPAGMPLHRPHA